ncbi:MAG TPA: hypothetical protein VFH39_02390 [Candidatus Saccharimonadales bacterium]|nr:hypothetical protein [Candidatus Saccharimonadales bacterium]
MSPNLTVIDTAPVRFTFNAEVDLRATPYVIPPSRQAFLAGMALEAYVTRGRETGLLIDMDEVITSLELDEEPRRRAQAFFWKGLRDGIRHGTRQKTVWLNVPATEGVIMDKSTAA